MLTSPPGTKYFSYSASQQILPPVISPGQVLMTMWSHAELREVYRKHGLREADFTTAARAALARPPAPSGEYPPALAPWTS